MLQERLEFRYYTHSNKTTGLLTHKWRPISSTLLEDNFGVKYTREEHANHLISVQEKYCVVKKDWIGEKYYWDYLRQKDHLSVPGYCSKALIKY